MNYNEVLVVFVLSILVVSAVVFITVSAYQLGYRLGHMIGMRQGVANYLRFGRELRTWQNKYKDN